MRLALWILFITLDLNCWKVKEEARTYYPPMTFGEGRQEATQDGRTIKVGGYHIQRFQIKASSGAFVPEWKWDQHPECFKVVKSSLAMNAPWEPAWMFFHSLHIGTGTAHFIYQPNANTKWKWDAQDTR